MTDAGRSEYLDWVAYRNPNQPEYVQALREIAEDVWDLLEENPRFRAARVLERLSEPDRVVSFRVAWGDDDGSVNVNRGYRVQTSNALGPHKGGLRFHPTVTESVLKFLGFEQTFKNALTGKPMAMGGSALRTEATGYGVVYFAEEALDQAGRSLAGRRCAVLAQVT